jgi:4'-phosphopantetheinyl transferase
LRLILGQLTNAPPQAVAFRFGPGGKPELAESRPPGIAPPLRFNVTHSDDLALIAVSLDRELGVDLERLRTVSAAARIVESYFTAAEQAQFAALEEPLRASAFLRGWTRKEAILKAKGVGLAGLAASYETMFGTTELTGKFAPATPLPRIGEWRLWEASPRAGYCAALAVQDVSRTGPNCLPAATPPPDLSLHGKQGNT